MPPKETNESLSMIIERSSGNLSQVLKEIPESILGILESTPPQKLRSEMQARLFLARQVTLLRAQDPELNLTQLLPILIGRIENLKRNGLLGNLDAEGLAKGAWFESDDPPEKIKRKLPQAVIRPLKGIKEHEFVGIAANLYAQLINKHIYGPKNLSHIQETLINKYGSAYQGIDWQEIAERGRRFYRSRSTNNSANTPNKTFDNIGLQFTTD